MGAGDPSHLIACAYATGQGGREAARTLLDNARNCYLRTKGALTPAGQTKPLALQQYGTPCCNRVPFGNIILWYGTNSRLIKRTLSSRAPSSIGTIFWATFPIAVGRSKQTCELTSCIVPRGTRGHDEVMQIRSIRGSGEPAWVNASCVLSIGTRSGAEHYGQRLHGRTNRPDT